MNINKIDSTCSFKANLETSVRVANKARLENIKKLFNKDTVKYPNEKLYILEEESGEISLQTSKQSSNPFHEKIYTNNLNELMNKYSDSKIEKKLTKAFKILRLADISDTLKKTIEYNEQKFMNNKRISNNLRKIGRDDFAEKYDIFAKFNKEKINTLKKQQESIRNDFYKEQKNASEQFPEVLQVEI